MVDAPKSKEQLEGEIKQLRQRVAELEAITTSTSTFERDISQTIIDTSPAFFVLIDAHGKTRMMNKAMLAALGYSENEIQGKDYLSTFVPERERDYLSVLFEKELLKGKPNRNQNHVLTKDGRELLVEWQGRSLSDSKGKVASFCGVGLDITERKQAEDSFQESEERYRRLSEAAFEGIAITEDGIIVDSNAQLAEMLGYSVTEIIGMKVASLVAPESRELVQERIQSGGETHYEHKAMRKDNSTFFVEVRAKEIPFKGKTARVTAIRDITEHKQAEEEVKRIAKEEDKRREELEKLREISANMRQAEGSSELLQVFTREVQKLCQADVASSILFKTRQEPISFFAPDAKISLSQEQSEAISKALTNAETGILTAKVPGFESVLVLQLQSSDTVFGAVMVASRALEAFHVDQQNLLNATADMAGTALNRIDTLETTEDRVRQRTRDLIVLYNLITIISENWHLQDWNCPWC